MKKKNICRTRYGTPMQVKSNQLLLPALCLLVLFGILLAPACKKNETEVVPMPVISGINKSMLNVGDTLVISGSNFNSDPAQDLVSVADVTFNVIKASSAQLSAIVPKGAQNGKLSVGFKQGQSATYSQLITIIGATSPVIKSITPAAGVYEGDTVVVRGSNFAIPYTSNSITFNGTAGRILNVTDSVMRVVVLNTSTSGPVQITSNGINSPGFQYNILKIDPNADGHLYWMIPVSSFSYSTFSYIYNEYFSKGLTNNASPQTTLIANLSNPNGLWPNNPNPYNAPNPNGLTFYADNAIFQSTRNNIVINDSQNKYGYYLGIDNYPFPSTFSMMRMSLTGSAATSAAVWTETVTNPVYTEYFANPADTITYPPVYIHYTPDQQFTADGNTAYIKMGLTDDYLVGDLSASSPSFTLQKNVFGDPMAYEPKFGQNYVFFQEIGPQYPQYNDNMPDAVVKLRYAARGSKTIMDVPFTLQASQSEVLINTLADPSHGNNLLIITTSLNPNTNFIYNTIYEFNADTKKVTTLYNYTNWIDGIGANAYGSPGNTGFAWIGTHIYYSNPRGNPVSSNGQQLFTALYRLNDNGITPKIYPVYAHLEPSVFSSPAPQFCFFLGQ